MQECKQSDKIRAMEIDIAVAKSDISNVKLDIGDIKGTLKSQTWWLIGILSSVIGGMALLLYNLNQRG